MRYSYSIAQVLIFFDTQSHRNFETIHEVLEIIDSKEVETEIKQEVIIQTLREAGFYDDIFIRNMPEALKQKVIAKYTKKINES